MQHSHIPWLDHQVHSKNKTGKIELAGFPWPLPAEMISAPSLLTSRQLSSGSPAAAAPTSLSNPIYTLNTPYTAFVNSCSIPHACMTKLVPVFLRETISIGWYFHFHFWRDLLTPGRRCWRAGPIMAASPPATFNILKLRLRCAMRSLSSMASSSWRLLSPFDGVIGKFSSSDGISRGQDSNDDNNMHKSKVNNTNFPVYVFVFWLL